MSKGKLLLADDSITIQKVVNLTFADEGIDVITVGDGDEAVVKAVEDHPDVILADVHMPGLTGYEVCEQIRANAETRDTPVILLVGSFEPFDEGEAARVGANAYLTKPFQSIRQLVSQVNELIESAKVRPEPAERAEAEHAANNQVQADTAGASVQPPPTEDIESFEIASYQRDPSLDVGAENDDIDSLYEQSLSDVGLDDDMIETSYSATPEAEIASEPLAEPAPGSSVEEFADEARTEEIHFDPAVLGTEAADEAHSGSHFSEPAESGFEMFPSNTDIVPPLAEDPVRDDALPPPVPFTSASQTAETERLPDLGEVGTVSVNSPFEQHAVDHEPAVIQPPGEDTEPMAERFDHTMSDTFRFEDIDLLELPPIGTNIEITSPPDAAEKGASKQIVTLSPELIEMIAQRVVEKLSEKY